MHILIEKELVGNSIRYRFRELHGAFEYNWVPPSSLTGKDLDKALSLMAEMYVRQNELDNQPQAPSLLAENEPEDLSNLTMAEFGVYYMTRKKIDLAEYTRSNWERCLNNRIYPWFGKKRIRSITPGDIEDFYLALKQLGLKNSSILTYHTILRSLFKFAAKRKAVSPNPMLEVERPKPRKDEEVVATPSAYTPDEIRHILECLNHEPLKWQVFVLILADTGIRRGECCALTWESIDYIHNTVSITLGAGYTSDSGVYITTTKNQRTRTLDIDPEIVSYIRFLYLEQLSSEKGLSPYLFPHRTRHDQPMLPCSATRYFAKFGAKYNMENMNPHRLRHSYASIAITSGADIASVSEVLGHSDKAFTLRRYTQANPKSMKEASQIRRNAIRKASEPDSFLCNQTKITEAF